jgi:hypothetical protein
MHRIYEMQWHEVFPLFVVKRFNVRPANTYCVETVADLEIFRRECNKFLDVGAALNPLVNPANTCW